MASFPALDVRYAPSPDATALQDLLYGELDPFEPTAIHEHDTGDGWRVFFRLPAQRDSARDALALALGDRLIEVSAVEVEDEDWARRSQAALTAIRVGRLTVAPPWDVPPSAAGEIVIVIEPSMGFGTGHHATTRLCLELLQQIDLIGQRVIDVGTGSGVLALAAWTLGAASIVAIDSDPDALQNARANIARNGAFAAIDVVEAELSAAPAADRADVVVANLTGAVLQRNARALRALVAPGGTLIVSGFSPDEVDELAAALGSAPRQVVRDGDWAAAIL